MNDEHVKEYVEYSIEVPKSLSDAICNFIVENISSGMVLEEEEDTQSIVIKFYSDNEEKNYQEMLKDYISQIVDNPNEIIESIRKSKVQSISWEEEYKKSVKPLHIDGDILIKPTWDKNEYEATYQIIIEPKMAFGTGSHETTRSCLKIVKEYFEPDSRFLDFGCGSGILSVLADKMNAGYIKAIDYDIISVENSIENFRINDLTTPNDVLHGSLELCNDDEQYNFICANIIRSTIIQYLKQLLELTIPSGILVLSGLLNNDEPEIIEALDKYHTTDYKIQRDNEWSSFIIFKE